MALLALRKVCVCISCQVIEVYLFVTYLALMSLLGPDSGGYYHKLFVREKAFLAEQIGRTIVKGKNCDELNSADCDPDVETIFAFRSEACRSSDIEDQDASRKSTNPTIAIAEETADEYSLLPTLVQSTSSKDLNIDLSKGTNRPGEMSLVQSRMSKYTALTPTYNLIEAIKGTSLSQQVTGRTQDTAGHSIQQEQIQRELYKMQANMMVHLEAEAINTILKSAAVPAAAYLEEYERLCLRSIDAMYERHRALSMHNEIGLLAARPFAPASSGFI